VEVLPRVEWYVLPWLDATLVYAFGFRQYLSSTYDTASGAPATENKQYFVNAGVLELEGDFGEIFKPTVTYEITYQESNNYDYLVSGNPADIFVPDYYDYLKHTLDIEADFRWTKAFSTEVGVRGSLQDFTNYPARDETKTFTGETRTDIDLDVDLEILYNLFTRQDSSVGIMLRGWWDISRSNMAYENSIDTNNDFYGVVAGIDVHLR
jgi:hypothetical protein